MRISQNRSAQIERLRAAIARIGHQPPRDDAVVPSGWQPLDRLLPSGGFRRGTLVEWLGVGQGNGAGTLAMAVAQAASRAGGALVVVQRRGEFYPPAAVRLGVDLENLIVVHTGSQADHVWALDQTLRCPGVAAVVTWVRQLDGQTFRRLQLAAERSGVLAVLIRPETARHEPSWADVRLLVEPLPSADCGGLRRVRICVLRCRGVVGLTEETEEEQAKRFRRESLTGRSLDVEFDDETRTMHLVAQLADPTSGRRTAGA